MSLPVTAARVRIASVSTGHRVANANNYSWCQYRTPHSKRRGRSWYRHTLSQYRTSHSRLLPPYAISVPAIASSDTVIRYASTGHRVG
eukprot:1089053-Rhodomonas_salina.2